MGGFQGMKREREKYPGCVSFSLIDVGNGSIAYIVFRCCISSGRRTARVDSLRSPICYANAGATSTIIGAWRLTHQGFAPIVECGHFVIDIVSGRNGLKFDPTFNHEGHWGHLLIFTNPLPTIMVVMQF